MRKCGRAWRRSSSPRTAWIIGASPAGTWISPSRPRYVVPWYVYSPRSTWKAWFIWPTVPASPTARAARSIEVMESPCVCANSSSRATSRRSAPRLAANAARSIRAKAVCPSHREALERRCSTTVTSAGVVAAADRMRWLPAGASRRLPGTAWNLCLLVDMMSSLPEFGNFRFRLRAPGNRGVDQGVGLGCVHREAAEGDTLVVGVDRRQRREVRAPAPRRRVPVAGRS